MTLRRRCTGFEWQPKRATLKHNVTSVTAYTKGGVSGAALHEPFSGTAKLRAMAMLRPSSIWPFATLTVTASRAVGSEQRNGSDALLVAAMCGPGSFFTSWRPNTRLKLTARVDYGMNLSSAHRGLSAIR